MTSKPDKTAADYMAISACPALIMILVGSLVFFLLQIGYAGQDLNRLRWTLFWFVFAMVLVSRIAIEQSTGAAFGYGLALAAATSIMLTRYIGFLWGIWVLLGLIWWTCNKIVWDCTLIDEDQDASGQGLLQAGHGPHWAVAPLAKVRAVSDPSLSGPAKPVPANRVVPSSPASKPLQKLGVASPPKGRKVRRRQDVHSPGLWVLYFSFAAIPVFGMGELLFSSNDSNNRFIGFGLLLAYLAAALSLLLLTSFLGLRRYLRQRFLVMPMAMAGSWVTSGGTLLFVVMLVALLLPRPATPYSLTGVVSKLSSRQRDDGRARSDAETTPQQRQEKNSPRPGSEDQGKATAGSEPETRSKSGIQKPNEPSGKEGNAKLLTEPPHLPDSAVWKWLPYVLVAGIIIFVARRFSPELREGLKALREWLKRSRTSTKKTTSAHAPSRHPAASIRLLSNPFQNGRAERMSSAELVAYSFEALKIWAVSRGFGSDPSETPLEFAERLAQREPALRHELLLLSSYYSHVAYANQAPPPEGIGVLRSLWLIIGFSKTS